MAENAQVGRSCCGTARCSPMDATHQVLTDADVLVVGDRIAAVGAGLEAPPGAEEIDASGGIVMPGMIDTHRHLWQTAMRGYGADWTLTQYFVWYYLEHGRKFRPEDIYAGNLLGRDRGDRRGRHHHRRLVARAADGRARRRRRRGAAGGPGPVRARVRQHPGRPVGVDRAARGAALPRGPQGPRRRPAAASSWPSTSPATRSFPERAAFEVARDLGLPVTTHAGVWGATNDDGIRLMHENGFATPETVYVHAATLNEDSYLRIAASGGSISVSTESEQSAGQGYPPTWQVRRYDIPVSLSMDTSVWWSGDLFSAMRTTLGADRAREHLEAHVAGETVTSAHLRAEHVVDWATRGGAQVLRARRPRQPRAGQEGRPDPDQERRLAGLLPAAQPVRARGLPGPTGRRAHRDHRRPDRQARPPAGRRRPGQGPQRRRGHGGLPAVVELGEDVWQAGMHPDLPADDKVLDNPYTYTEFRTAATREARESIFGEVGVELSMAGRGNGPDFVEALARGLDVLTCFDASRPTMTLSEVAVAAGLARPTARRLLLTLAELGYVRINDSTFALTPKVLGLGIAYTSSLGLVGHRPAAPGGAGRADRRVVVDGPAGRLRHRLRGPGLGAQDHRAAGRHRHPVPGRAGPRRARCCWPR